MADSLRDYFIRFLFKTDKHGAHEAHSQIEGLAHSIEELGKKAFVLNQVTQAFGELLEPFKKFGEFITQTAEEADAVAKLSERTGVATEKLEGYAFMAKLAGASSDTMMIGVRKLDQQLGEAANGSKESAENFARLGIHIRDANGHIKKVDDLLPEVADALNRLPSHAQKTASAIKLFGRAGQELLPILSKGGEHMRELQQELVDLGGVASEDLLSSSEEYSDNLEKIRQVWKGIKREVAGPFIKAINESTNAFIEWWKASGAIIRQRIGEWAFQAVTSFKALWAMISRVSTVLLLMAAALNIPLLAMIGMHLLIGLIIDDFANWMAGNDSLIGRAIANWDDWLAELEKTNPQLAAVMKGIGETIKFFHDGAVKLGQDWDRFLAEFDGDTIANVAKGAWESIRDFLFAPFIETAERLKTTIYDVLMFMKRTAAALGMDDLAKSLGGLASGTMGGAGLSHDIGGGRVLPNGVGGPAGALAAGPSGPGGGVNAQTTINVQAAPGMDEKKLAQEVGKQFDMRFDSAMRQGFNTAVPEHY